MQTSEESLRRVGQDYRATEAEAGGQRPSVSWLMARRAFATFAGNTKAFANPEIQYQDFPLLHVLGLLGLFAPLSLHTKITVTARSKPTNLY